MRFFKALEGSHYPTSAITRIGKAREVTYTSGRKGLIHNVYLRGDEDPIEADEHVVNELLGLPQMAFPAAPSTYIVRPSEDGKEFWRTPVVGWSLIGDGSMVPVTVEGLNDGETQSLNVMLPDGRVQHPFIGNWETADEWLEHLATGQS